MKLYLLVDAKQWSYKQTPLQQSAQGKFSFPPSARPPRSWEGARKFIPFEIYPWEGRHSAPSGGWGVAQRPFCPSAKDVLRAMAQALAMLEIAWAAAMGARGDSWAMKMSLKKGKKMLYFSVSNGIHKGSGWNDGHKCMKHDGWDHIHYRKKYPWE